MTIDHNEKEKNVRSYISDSEIIQYLKKHLHKGWNNEYTTDKKSIKHPRIIPGRLKFKMSLALQKRKCKEKRKVHSVHFGGARRQITMNVLLTRRG